MASSDNNNISDNNNNNNNNQFFLSPAPSPIPSLASYTAMTVNNNNNSNSNNSNNNNNNNSNNPTSSSWVVHKFGGTSLACADCYRLAANIIINIIQENKKLSNNNNNNNNNNNQRPPRIAVVVSAMGEVKSKGEVANLIKKNHPSLQTIESKDKVTNLIIKATNLAAQQNNDYKLIINQLKERHLTVIDDLLQSVSSDSASIVELAKQLIHDLKESINNDLIDFSNILRGVWLSKRVQEEGVQGCWWFGYGELWSHKIMTAYLKLFAQRINSSAFSDNNNNNNNNNNNDCLSIASLDARDVVILQKQSDIVPDYSVSEKKLQQFLSKTNANIVVITGYIATSAQGFPTTLGRDGSDYSASIFAALLKSSSATIWTDVDGVYSANPSQVKEAVVLDELSYDEASELAYFGAKVIHPKTMTPVVFHKIPIWIRNTFRSDHPGTCIRAASQIALNKKNNNIIAAPKPLALSSSSSLNDEKTSLDINDSDKKNHSIPATEYTMSHGVKGFSEIGNLALIRVEGTGMVGVSGVAYRLFGALRSAAFSVILITQAGSEHSICIALPMSQGDMGVQLIRREFRQELENGDIQTVDMSGPSACLAVVGDGMRHTMGVAGRFFSALANANINIQAIAQGGSERNISAIISQSDVTKALTAAHNAFLAPK